MAGDVVAAILLAAGESRRMGSPKALLPWQGTTLIAYQVDQILEAGAHPVVVVLGHEAERAASVWTPQLGVATAINTAYRQGRSASIRVGVESLPQNVRAILIHSVDQPRRAETLRTLISAHLSGNQMITMPSYQGRRGHPPVLSASLRPELCCLAEGNQGLREVMIRHAGESRVIPFDTPEVLFNLNTPEDYHLALAHFQAWS